MQITDDLNRIIRLDAAPIRIICLVPSLTELLFDLGLEDRIVGITKFCIRPSRALKKVSKIGGTKKFDFDQIEKLNPDLIIANKEENYKKGVEKLIDLYPVYVSDIYDLNDACRNILNIGLLTETKPIAEQLLNQIKTGFDKVKGQAKGRLLYFIWQKPDMVAASDNFIDHLMNWLGFENAASHLTRYPELSELALQELHADYIFLSSEPYPFKEKHLSRFKLLFPRSKVFLVDGEMFSWYGSRLALAPTYFKGLLSSLD